MKRQLIYLFASAAILTAGCSKNETEADGLGTLAIRTAADASVITRSTPSGAEFALRITGDEFDRTWETVAAFDAADTPLPKGRYMASITHGDPEAEGPEKPYYAGEKTFDLLPRRVNTVEITAQLANSQVFVGATAQFVKYFHDANFTLTTASGTTYDFKPGTDTPGEVIFIPAGTRLKVTGSALRQPATDTDQGGLVTFPEQTVAAAKARTRHTFTFDAADAGSATVSILLGEDEVYTEQFVFELNDDAVYE